MFTIIHECYFIFMNNIQSSESSESFENDVVPQDIKDIIDKAIDKMIADESSVRIKSHNQNLHNPEKDKPFRFNLIFFDKKTFILNLQGCKSF